MAVQEMPFQAEVSRLLDIVAHALYSDREVFLRELVSNASDACDRHRYLALTQPDVAGEAGSHRILLTPDKAARTLTVADNGIGMSREELAENLGTIARSGTGRFMAELTGDAKKDMSLIGQFGVGFYAAFMVADRVEVTSRKAGEETAWRWTSDGRTGFALEEAEKAERGTSITLHLREDAGEFLDGERLRRIVRRYSDHIALPILLAEEGKEETLNSASALWTRSRSEITEEQATELYRHLGGAGETPYATVHVKAEGTLEYSALLFVPGAKPFDLFNPERRHGVKLYVRRVFITDECPDLVPGWLRFLKGVVDSSDLPLNVSRELLQSNPMIARMRSNLVKKTLAELERKAGEADYPAFWENFGAVLKEGLYEEAEHRDALLKLARFRTSLSDEPVSLDTYLSRMRPGQEAIYTLSAETPEAAKASPQLEGFRAKEVEVLLLTDPVDEFWMPMVAAYQGKPFKSVTRGGADLGAIEGGAAPAEEPAPAGEIGTLVALFKLALQDEVKDVRPSQRLTDSAVCLVADEHDMDMRLEKLLRQHKQLDAATRRVLEINPRHPLIRRLAERTGEAGAADRLGDAARLLLDQARILEGEVPPDPRAFARRLDQALLAELGPVSQASAAGEPIPADTAAA